VIEETAWIAGGTVDAGELLKVWSHVHRKYNALKKQLGYPYTRWWEALSPRRLYRRIWWWWYTGGSGGGGIPEDLVVVVRPHGGAKA
jgi:hypothetical protein